MAVLTITVLGSGTSMGVPTLGCDCKVCTSSDVRDSRLRPSIMVQSEGRTVLVDTTPDFRQQALRESIHRIDAILFTHAHADHIMGLDDVRPINLKQKGAIPLYGPPEALATIRQAFAYAFENVNHESTVPRLELRPVGLERFDAAGITFEALMLHHGKGRVYGYRFGDCAYLTDHSDIPAETLERLHGLDVLFLDALRHKPHPTHTTLSQALKYVEELKPNRAFFTHISHDLPHDRTESTFPEGVHLAYDGLRIHVGHEDAR
ncbi:MAG TPA: MBL fold metallo-hydrolase [Bryobacteraceae bacterium]|nr:MBL fold metallo-hydrolase [Bryobacteraceae bacterium]